MSEPKIRDVLISCAEDTHQGFVGHLFKSLTDLGFSVKVVSGDHRDLKEEEIECFRVFIIVFSHHYATSSSRLDKLTEIINKYGAAEDRRIFPFFFEVEPNHVRFQSGSFEIAFDSHANRVESECLQRWKITLKKVTDFSGWSFNRSEKTYQYQVIEKIVQKVSDHVACSVGLHCRVEKVNDLLKSESDDTVRVLVYGESGIGKTTVVRGVCRSNGGKFAYYCFLEKVGENLRNHGSRHLIRMLFSKIIGDNDSEFGTEEILRKKGKQLGKSLLVFEDIFDQEQLEYIVKVASDCFSFNSKVIITAEKNCFLKCPEIEIYEVERLTKQESTDLFILKAFNCRNPKIKHLKIITQAVTMAPWVPYTLELIASYFREKSAEHCQRILDEYEKIPNEKKKQVIVQMIFDALSCDQKKMLIHIAYNLIGQEKAIVEDRLHRLFGVWAKDGIDMLLHKSLVKIDEQGQVTMHHLTHNMVKDMVRLI
ncbi:hypothetical protein AAZV13_13G163300 [Glycine max]